MDADVPFSKIDATVPASARIWNYWLGGKDYYPVDKMAGDQFAQFFPGIFDMASASRHFIARAVRYLAGEAGVRQFLDIGTGLPSHDSTSEIVQRVAPDSRIAYVDNDQFVLARAQARSSGAGGVTDYIEADLDQPEALLRVARDKLDFSRPVAIMLMGVLGHIGNAEEDDDRVAQSIVGTLKAALPSGGYLAIYDTSDVSNGQNDALRRYNESGADPYRVRRPDQIARFFAGLELVEPGVVPVQQWRPDDTPVALPQDLTNLGGVGKKALSAGTGLDMGTVLSAGREILDEGPRARAELGRLLAARWPGRDLVSLGYAVSYLLPVVQVPPRGVWGASAPPKLAPAESWLGQVLGEGAPVTSLVLRYLAAFGPATVADVQAWSGLTRLAEVTDELRPQLLAFRDEDGRELLDLPDAPRPDPETPAPPRFLPEYDNVLLSHADRRRLIPDGHPVPLPPGNGARCGTLLADGLFSATWRITRQAGAATLHVEPFRPLPDRDPVAEEGARLLEFAAADAGRHFVQFD